MDFLQTIKRIRYKLFLLFIFFVVPLLGYFLINTTAKTVFLNVNQEIAKSIKILAFEQEGWIDRTHFLMQVLAEFPEIQNPTRTDCAALLRQIIVIYPRYLNIGVADNAGKVLCSAAPYTDNPNVSNESYFKKTLLQKDFTIGQFQLDTISKKPTLVFGHPVFNQAGNIKYVIFASMDLEWMKALFSQVSLPSGSTLVATDRNGTILYSSIEPARWIGKLVPEADVLKIVLAEQTGTIETLGQDGVRRVYAFTSLSGTDGNVLSITGIPKSFAYTQALNTIMPYALVFIMTVLVIFAIIWRKRK
jgi:hypothetical protein